ncbi:tRNA epoxyqueuosine(34) reductase QueG [Halanaerobacter jeridensis]|uniref:Epoxyqueuosine reductase n=1 Tax=Halanaerobacter jeridensis TaxID=706427 RepID=A0A938XQF1_9FIRM|nr:epoxyqueuosine reductase [Halanaerobacter jeridensis]
MNLAKDIKNYGAEISLDEVKITDADDLDEVEEFLKERKEAGELSKFLKSDLDLITSPREVLPEAKSVIVVAISYYHPPQQKRGSLEGKLSQFAQGKDYHQVLEAKLEQLADFVEQLQTGVETYQFVDTAPTVDRALARKAGVGWQGKNCSIIHPQYGSWIFIGGLITNLELEIDEPLENKCGDCSRCLDNCPTGALKDNYTLNAEECLGQVTLTKGYLSIQERKKIGVRVWGCDTCQEVCPYNQDVKVSHQPEFKAQNLGVYPKLLPLLKLTNQDFREKFSSTVMNWRGKRPIKRNAAIILGNLKAVAAVPDLITTLKEDPQAIVRGHAAWALGEIGTAQAKQALKDALDFEQDKKVRAEIKRGQR